MDNTINTKATQATSDVIGVTGGGSIQLIFAQLQMELAKSNKESALRRIDDIQADQAKSAEITAAINSLRNLKTQMGTADEDEVSISSFGSIDSNMTKEQRAQELNRAQNYLAQAQTLQNQARAGEADEDSEQGVANENASGESESTMMTTEMEQYFKNNGLSYDDSGNSRRQNADEWNEAILSLQGRVSYLQAQSLCQQYNIDLPTSGKLTNERLDEVIASLQAVQEEVGSNIQQEMVLIQDSMGQYNSYTQGASSAISQAYETLKAVTRGS